MGLGLPHSSLLETLRQGGEAPLARSVLQGGRKEATLFFDKIHLSWALLADVIRVIGCSDADLQVG